MEPEDLVSLLIAMRGAVAHLQTAVALLTWRTGATRSENEQRLLDNAKLVLEAARALEQDAPPPPQGTERQLRGQFGKAFPPPNPQPSTA